MRAEEKYRPTAVDQMQRLQHLGLGWYEQGDHETRPRDKFQLENDYVGVLAVRETNGFIRADDRSLLFRAVTGQLLSAFPEALRSRAL